MRELVSSDLYAWNVLSSQHGLLSLREEDGREERRGKVKQPRISKWLIYLELFVQFQTIANTF